MCEKGQKISIEVRLWVEIWKEILQQRRLQLQRLQFLFSSFSMEERANAVDVVLVIGDQKGRKRWKRSFLV
jgi:hypothetical protein